MRLRIILLLTLAVIRTEPVAAFPIGDNQANNVFGQTNFNTGYVDINTDQFFGAQLASGGTMFLPYDTDYDSARDWLYVADLHNHRALIFSLATLTTTGKKALYEVGQPNGSTGGSSPATPYGNVDTKNPIWGCNTEINACGMKRVYSVAFDQTHGILFVADSDNHRILAWRLSTISNGRSASFVLGQPDFTTAERNQPCSGAPTETPSACGLNFPTNLAYDNAHNILYVADQNNNRVISYNMAGGVSNFMAANHVWGQATLNVGGRNAKCVGAKATNVTNQCGLSGPTGVTIDVVGNRLFVADSGNHRVMVYSTVAGGAVANHSPATQVLGQPNFTTNTSNTSCGGGASGDINTNQCGLGSFESFVDYDALNNRLIVTDSSNHRILFFDATSIANGQAATALLGQANFTTGYNPAAANFGGGTSRTRMLLPAGLVMDGRRDRLFVADGGNHRVLMYGANVNGKAVQLKGQTDSVTSLNNDGTTTVSMIDSRGDSYWVQFPANTTALPGSEISVTISNVAGFDRPRTKVSAQLPPGTTKALAIPTGDVSFVCAVDKIASTFSITNCSPAFKHPLPAPGTCVTVAARGEVGDNPTNPTDPKGLHDINICLDAGSTEVILTGLLHSEVAATNLWGQMADDNGIFPPKGTGNTPDGAEPDDSDFQDSESGGCSSSGHDAGLLVACALLAALALLRRRATA